jgi:hypothetical protein
MLGEDLVKCASPVKSGRAVSCRYARVAVLTARILSLSRWAIGIALALFVLPLVLSPGGTTKDASAERYGFFRNFGSDLGRTVALTANRASQLDSRLGGVLLMPGTVVPTTSFVARVLSGP